MITFNKPITEKTFDINAEVDYLYDLFFKEYIDAFDIDNPAPLPRTFGTILGPDFVEDMNNPDIEDAHDSIWLEEITTYSNRGNVYLPSDGEATINLSLPKPAHDAIKSGIVNQLNDRQRRSIMNEFTEARMKGSIMHELSHWLNDALHGRFLSKRVDRGITSTDRLKTLNQGKSRTHQFLTDYELDAQVHAIIQFRRKNARMWERIDLDTALQKMPFYMPLYDTLSRAERKQWKRYMYTRLARENLLGRQMKRAKHLGEANYDYINQCATNDGEVQL